MTCMYVFYLFICIQVLVNRNHFAQKNKTKKQQTKKQQGTGNTVQGLLLHVKLSLLASSPPSLEITDSIILIVFIPLNFIP